MQRLEKRTHVFHPSPPPAANFLSPGADQDESHHGSDAGKRSTGDVPKSDSISANGECDRHAFHCDGKLHITTYGELLRIPGQLPTGSTWHHAADMRHGLGSTTTPLTSF